MSNQTIKTTIAQEGIEKLTRYSRMYSFLMSSFTKTYIKFEDSSAILYFKGNKSVLSISVPLETAITDTQWVSVDIQKFLSAAKKVAGNNGLVLTFNRTPPTLRMSSDTTNDKITLSVSYYEETNSEVVSLATFYTEHEQSFESGSQVSITQDLLDFVHISSTYMSTINKNNSIAIYNDRLVYADRTIILKLATKVLESTIVNEPILIHKFVLGFLEFVASDTPVFMIDEARSSILWKSGEDDNFWAIIAIDPCNIAIPDQSDIDSIIPEKTAQQVALIKPNRFVEAIDFFNGLFEASVWKPITFFWNYNSGDQKIKLSYQHPTTEVEKDLIVEEFQGELEKVAEMSSFILISDSVRTLLSRISQNGLIRLHFNAQASDQAHGAGVLITYTDEAGIEKYSAVLAKLQDN
jgi:hypothetical protein